MSDMHEEIQHPTPGHRDHCLALLDDKGAGRPNTLRVISLSWGMVQAMIGAPPGLIRLEGAPASVLIFHMSPVQALRQTREGRSFVGNLLHGEMTLMPAGVPSQWSCNSARDRLNVTVFPDLFGDGSKLDVVDRFVLRDPEMESICRRLYCELSRHDTPQRLFVEALAMKLAVSLRQRYSTTTEAARILPSGGLSRNQVRPVLEYIESNLSRDLTLRQLLEIADLSLHHLRVCANKPWAWQRYRCVLERRLERAKMMLRSATATLVDISLSTGFASQSHFTSAFRRMVGATPTEFQGSYRKRRRRR